MHEKAVIACLRWWPLHAGSVDYTSPKVHVVQSMAITSSSYEWKELLWLLSGTQLGILCHCLLLSSALLTTLLPVGMQYIVLNNATTVCLALYPGLLTPAFVACSTNAGEGLVKLSHVVRRTWTCGGVAHSFSTAVKRLSESKKRCQDCLMSSAQSFYIYGPCLQSVAHSLTCCFSRNMPLLHTSRYVIPRDSVLLGLPPR